MHVDGAWANEQRLGDLAIRSPHRDEAEHLELTSRQSGVLEPTCRSTTESPLDLLTEQSQLFGHSGRERAGAEPSGSAVGGGEALDCQPTLPVGCQRDADSELGLGPPIRGEVGHDVDGLSS